MALNGMGRYAEAIKTLKTLAELAPEDDAAAHALMECEHLQAQAFTGTFEVPALLFGETSDVVPSLRGLRRPDQDRARGAPSRTAAGS